MNLISNRFPSIDVTDSRALSNLESPAINRCQRVLFMKSRSSTTGAAKLMSAHFTREVNVREESSVRLDTAGNAATMLKGFAEKAAETANSSMALSQSRSKMKMRRRKRKTHKWMSMT